VDVGDDGAFWGFEPLAVLGDVGEEAHGLKDGIAGEGGVVDAFEETLGDPAKIAAAKSDEAVGFGVTIERGTAGKIVGVGDVPRIVPVEEVVLDLFTVRMVADGAFASVASERGFGRARPDGLFRMRLRLSLLECVQAREAGLEVFEFGVLRQSWGFAG
jgi:hypothetical protein